IMLVNVKEEEKESSRIFTGQYIPAVILAFLLGGLFLFAITRVQVGAGKSLVETSAKAQQDYLQTETALQAKPAVQAGKRSQNTQQVGLALYSQAALPFEIASVLLLVAMVGSVMLARGRRQEMKSGDEPDV